MAPEDEDPVRTAVAANLRALKAIRRVTDRKIGADLGVSHAWVNDRMRGKTECSASDLQRLADYFGVEPAQLMSQTPIILATSTRDAQMELALGNFERAFAVVG